MITNTIKKAPGASDSKGLTTDTNGGNFLTDGAINQALVIGTNHPQNVTGWRGALAAGNPAFRKYGSYDEAADARRERRALARKLAKAVKTGDKK